MGKHASQEYKDFVSKLIVEEGRSATDVAYELELSYSTVRKWAAAYRQRLKGGHENETYITPSELKKMEADHAKKMQALEEENEILKKAMHIFTKNQE